MPVGRLLRLLRPVASMLRELAMSRKAGLVRGGEMANSESQGKKWKGTPVGPVPAARQLFKSQSLLPK